MYEQFYTLTQMFFKSLIKKSHVCSSKHAELRKLYEGHQQVNSVCPCLHAVSVEDESQSSFKNSLHEFHPCQRMSES